jgi:hypothetical protein
LLCHFNNNYTCVDGEEPTYSSTSFQSGKTGQGVLIDGFDILYYDSLQNIDLNNGTIEFWFKPLNTLSGESWLFKLGDGTTYNENEMEISITNYEIYFVLYDEEANSMGLIKSISWNTGEWHHVAAMWNMETLTIDMYIDGSDSGNTPFNNGFNVVSDTPDKIFLGSKDAATNQANGVFDELRISNSYRTSEEINQDYQNALLNYTNMTANWTITNVPDGTYLWNCLAYNDSGSSWATSNYTFYVDTNTPPTVNEIMLFPSSMDEIDPGITINVTANVSDISNVSAVIFQWKEVGEWNSVTMDYNGLTGLYENASIPIEVTGGTYYYRVWSNDTNGNSGNSDTRNISAEWDYTWDASPYNFTISGVIDTYNSTFLTINNTGDDALSFILTHDWISDIYFNGSLDIFSFALDKGKVSVINVMVHFLIYTSELNTHIIINSSHTTQTPSPKSMSINGTINSFVGGPYFDLDITDYPSTIYQSQNANLTAKIKNIGNETATDVWLNWTLPSGWSNTSGNLIKYLGNITPGSVRQENISVTLDPLTAIAGIVNVYVNASCNEAVSSSDSRMIGVYCSNADNICGAGCSYVTDDDCLIPSGGNLGVGETTGILIPSNASEKKTFLVSTEGIIELVRGLSGSFVLKVTNPYEYRNLTNISLNISGYPSQYIKVKPTSIEKMIKNQTKEFTVFIEVPEYFTKSEYTLKFIITGYDRSREITGNAEVALSIHEISREESIKYLNKSQSILNEMRENGFNVKEILDLAVKANESFEKRDYEQVRIIYDEIIGIRDTAYQTKYLMDSVENEIADNERNGLKVSSTKNLLSLSKAAFMRGDFLTALKRIEESQQTMSLETKGKVNYVKFVLDYWWAIIIGIATTLIIGYLVKLRIEIYKTDDIIKDLQREELAITDKMNEAKEKTFKENLMSMPDYHKAMYDYQKKLTEINKKMAKLRARRNVKDEMKKLEDEEDRIGKLIGETQKSYFQKGEIGKSVYENRIRSFTDSLAEVEKNMMMLRPNQKHKR